MLDLAEKAILDQGWPNFDLVHLARATGRPLYEIQGMYGDKYGLLAALVDAHTAAMDPVPLSQDPHEYLFEVFMARFDVLEDKRPLIALLRESAFHDFKLGCVVARALENWLRTSLGGMNVGSSWTELRVKALLLVYLAALDVWLVDESADLSPTMATLDQRLHDFQCVLG